MVSSAPAITFAPTAIAFGVCNVGASTAKSTYHVKNASGSYAAAKNVSVSFYGSTNASEAKTGAWVYESTAWKAGYVASVGGAECNAPSVNQAASIRIATKVKVPASPTSSGTVLFRHHVRYQYTG